MRALIGVIVGLVLAGAIGRLWAGLRREITLWRWRHDHPARAPLRVVRPRKKRHAAA